MSGGMHDLTDVAMTPRLFRQVVVEREAHRDRRVQDEHKSCDLFHSHETNFYISAVNMSSETGESLIL